ncbi:alkaline phosphatase [Draconibacterium sediminis]|uniref:Alkaline phosphatase n=1 Tax=Draconibacterium sediminis TaxID=1544798 RepID=A0A0D8J656_9BACT|nr:alkaline phosphatase [Draconibacterium sediminis]KJF42450.1 alkaline phosphatase [Draconibacterium sediminis]
MLQKLFFSLAFCALSFGTFAQDAYLNAESEDTDKVYPGNAPYEVKMYPQKFKAEKPKNIIFLIGDGMGVSQVFAGITANQGHLFLDNFRHIGFSKTQSADNYITDSAAGGTALACGVRTYNGAIGVDTDTAKVKSILEEAEAKGLATGLVSTSAITHATPASFIAHQPSRNMYENIAADFLNTDIDVFIGGGNDHFTKRKDGRNLANELKEKGYTVETDIEKIAKVKSGKLAGLTAEVHNGRTAERGDMLPVATSTAINILDNNDKGFFLMIEGSQIDWGGHASSTVYIVEDMLDFDQTIGKALEFAAKDGETLVLVTADHETGGMALTGGDMSTGRVKADYPTTGHTAVMVPVFAYGPGAKEFMGIMDNTDIHDKMKKLLLSK